MSVIGITLIAFFVLLFLGLPVVFVLGVCSIFYFVVSGSIQLLYTVPTRLFQGIDSFVLMAIPLFIFAGEIMNRGAIVESLISLADVLVGKVRGGLAYVNVLDSTFFGGITGSALSDVAALGSIMIPAMEKAGYDKEFSTAVTAATAIQGPLIPPSIPAVLVSAATGISVGALFLGGAIPGLLVGLSCAVIVYIRSRKRNYPRSQEDFTVKRLLRGITAAFFPLLTPLIIMGGILTGIFTPTEAAAVAVLYALVLTGLVYRSLSGKDFLSSLLCTIMATSKIFLIIGAASIFSWILSIENIPTVMADWLLGFSDNAVVTLVMINIFVLFWGMWIDTAPAIVLLLPILYPVAKKIGLHDVHFGVIMVLNLMIGQLTPPFGMTLFTAQAVGKCPLMGLIKELVPFILAQVVVLVLVSYIPLVSMVLPKLFGLIEQ
jgi:tripartite ATP-independent transporter DctM subunit